MFLTLVQLIEHRLREELTLQEEVIDNILIFLQMDRQQTLVSLHPSMLTVYHILVIEKKIMVT